ncbi:hypothetical protein K450DRAFT_200888 [Umbelopsis ramanniana AG]|uniref:Uncharacterized protein n=1 Tax=Umbelopsis ramanniana AG TaxID=1314678 RepID=A0AAD5E6X2_UMBRA|nr:uncharacterized protein K450DRAFT_200888 [Umbelopsis ramanniana AG]KAI8577842.1 hypothetical protein K450DRAFT_200888 [Umbelopsis ramanniana AG]
MNSTDCFADSSIISGIRTNNWTIAYLSLCLSCSIWQILSSLQLAWVARKPVHAVVLFQSTISFLSILFSLLNPLTMLNCDARYWVSIVTVNLGGICIQSVLLYKAYVCNERARWLLGIGALAQCGYIVLMVLDATSGRVTSTQDPITGMCSNGGLRLQKSAWTFSATLFSHLLSCEWIGVILSNLIVGILIASRVTGGLSADLYAFDWIVTSYLLIKQFRRDHKRPESRPNSYPVPQFSYQTSEDLPMTSGHVVPYISEMTMTPLCAQCEKNIQHAR